MSERGREKEGVGVGERKRGRKIEKKRWRRKGGKGEGGREGGRKGERKREREGERNGKRGKEEEREWKREGGRGCNIHLHICIMVCLPWLGWSEDLVKEAWSQDRKEACQKAGLKLDSVKKSDYDDSMKSSPLLRDVTHTLAVKNVLPVTVSSTVCIYMYIRTCTYVPLKATNFCKY